MGPSIALISSRVAGASMAAGAAITECRALLHYSAVSLPLARTRLFVTTAGCVASWDRECDYGEAYHDDTPDMPEDPPPPASRDQLEDLPAHVFLELFASALRMLLCSRRLTAAPIQYILPPLRRPIHHFRGSPRAPSSRRNRGPVQASLPRGHAWGAAPRARRMGEEEESKRARPAGRCAAGARSLD